MAEMDDIEPPAENAHYFDNAALSDVTIYFGNDNDQLKLHKVILASSSEHFRKMFKGGFAESTTKDIHLKDDDPAAMFGLLAWCYGLQYSGRRTFKIGQHGSYPTYHGDNEMDDYGHLDYMANLYVAADKYMVSSLKEHARQNWEEATQEYICRYTGGFTDQQLLDEFVWILRGIATLVYVTLQDSARELRPCLAKAVHECIGYLVDHEHFKTLMVEIPELAFDLLALSTKSKRSKGFQNNVGMPPTIDAFVVPDHELN